MKIEVIPFAAALGEETVLNKTVVVIDVLRATSVMVTALANNAKEIIPAVSIERAKELAVHFPAHQVLLCGERDAKKIEGFDLGNSPLEFSHETVSGKTIILTTTNGTKALHATKGAKQVFIGAFLNADSLAEKIKDEQEVVLALSGTNGRFSMDDAMCAALVMKKISNEKTIDPDDLGIALINIFDYHKGNLNAMLKDCFHLNYLIENGHGNDVQYCLNVNLIELVPTYKNEKVTVSSSNYQ